MTDHGPGLLALRAEMALSNRFRISRDEPDADTWQERVASGLYAVGRSRDRLHHAVRFPGYLADIREALELIGTPKTDLGHKLLAHAAYRKALCGIEVFMDGMDYVRSWVPSKTACPACVKAC